LQVAIRTIWIFDDDYYHRRFSWVGLWPESTASSSWTRETNPDANTWTSVPAGPSNPQYRFPTSNGSPYTTTSTNWGSSVIPIVHRTQKNCYRGGVNRFGYCFYHIRPYWWQWKDWLPGMKPRASGDGEFDEWHPSRIPNYAASPPAYLARITATTQYDMTDPYSTKTAGHTFTFYVNQDHKLTMLMTRPGNPNMTPINWYNPFIMRY
jgi:hypothetical protein